MSRKDLVISYYKDYRIRLNKLLDLVEVDDLVRVIQTLLTTFKNGKTVFLCGNGGSATTASHIQADFTFFLRNFTKFRPKVRALTDNVSIITAVGNDTIFHDIFVEQLKGQFEKGDIIICISASGNSENVIRAAQFANENGGTSIGFIGFTGGKLKTTCKISLHTKNPNGDYGPIEDLHMIYSHLIVNFFSQDKEFLSIPEK